MFTAMTESIHATRAVTLAHLAAEVQLRRAELGLGQNAFARKAGVDPSILSRLLAGKATAGPSERRLRSYLRRLARNGQRG